MTRKLAGEGGRAGLEWSCQGEAVACQAVRDVRRPSESCAGRLRRAPAVRVVRRPSESCRLVRRPGPQYYPAPRAGSSARREPPSPHRRRRKDAREKRREEEKAKQREWVGECVGERARMLPLPRSPPARVLVTAAAAAPVRCRP